jgi:uncharacterized protein YdaU (DUF1376 family)
MNYYEHHLGDYMRDTAHLSLLEDGAYRRLIDAYYVRERPLPIDLKECCKLARAVTKPERDAVAYVLKEFFERTEEGYRQKRCDEVLQKYLDKKNKAAASANARWSQCERNANASKTHMRTACEVDAPSNQYPVTSNQEEAQSASRAPTPAGEMAIALRDLGVSVKSTDKALLDWLRDGFTTQQAVDAVGIARIRKPHPEVIPPNYLDRILRQPARPPPASALERVTWRPPADEDDDRVPN